MLCKRLPSTQSTKNAFTLIELLVVIAIIAILAAILFPVFAKVREKARAITCVSNMKQIGLGFMQYVQDNDETFPRWQLNIVPTDGNTLRTWPNAVYPYIKNGDHSIDIDGTPATWGNSGIFVCPDYGVQNAGTSYGVNITMMQEGPDDYVAQADIKPSATLADLQTPADSVMAIETGVNDGGSSYDIFDPDEALWTTTVGTPPGSHPNDLDLQYDCDATAAQIASEAWSYPGCGMFPRYRHTNTSNMIFSDGHVKAMNRGRLNWYQNIYVQGVYERAGVYQPVY